MKSNHRTSHFLTLAFTLLFSSSLLAELVIEDGYVRKPIPGRSMSAAFMSINNAGKNDVVLKTASIEGAKSVEIHTHSHKNGVMRMRQLHELVVKAGETIVLEPGSLHLMVFGIEELPENPSLSLCDDSNNCFQSLLSVRHLVRKQQD